MDYIFFDFDGTLVNTSEGIFNCLRYSMDYMNFPHDENTKLHEFIGPPLHGKMKEFCGYSEEDATIAVAKFRERYNETGVFESKPYDGIVDAIKRLKSAGKKVCVATSKPEWQAVRLCIKYGISDYLDEAVGSSLDGRICTKSDVIKELLRKLGNPDTDNILMVGDRLYDVEGANDFNIKTLGVSYGFGSREELLNAGAIDVVDTTAQIADYILKD